MKVRFALSAGLGAPDAETLSTVVTGAEAHGFDGLWFSDVPLLPATDPFLAVAFAAARSQPPEAGRQPRSLRPCSRSCSPARSRSSISSAAAGSW